MMYLPSERIYVSFSQIPGALAILDHCYPDTRIMKTWSWAKPFPVGTCLLPRYFDPGCSPSGSQPQIRGGPSALLPTWQTSASNSMAPSPKSSIAQSFTLLAVPSKTGKHIQAKSSPKHGASLLGPSSSSNPDQVILHYFYLSLVPPDK